MKHDLQKTVEITNQLIKLFYDKYEPSPYLPKLKIYFNYEPTIKLDDLVYRGDPNEPIKTCDLVYRDGVHNLVYSTHNGDEPTIIDISKVPNNQLDAIIYFFDKYFVYYSFGCLTISHFLDLVDNVFYEKGHLFDHKLQLKTTIKGYEWGKFSDYPRYFDRYTKEIFIELLLEKYV